MEREGVHNVLCTQCMISICMIENNTSSDHWNFRGQPKWNTSSRCILWTDTKWQLWHHPTTLRAMDGPDDNRFDLRPLLYNTRWSWQYRAIDNQVGIQQSTWHFTVDLSHLLVINGFSGFDLISQELWTSTESTEHGKLLLFHTQVSKMEVGNDTHT
jgi:hypothetical protein